MQEGACAPQCAMWRVGRFGMSFFMWQRLRETSREPITHPHSLQTSSSTVSQRYFGYGGSWDCWGLTTRPAATMLYIRHDRTYGNSTIQLGTERRGREWPARVRVYTMGGGLASRPRAHQANAPIWCLIKCQIELNFTVGARAALVMDLLCSQGLAERLGQGAHLS